jgi:hypothetical protein
MLIHAVIACACHIPHGTKVHKVNGTKIYELIDEISVKVDGVPTQIVTKSDAVKYLMDPENVGSYTVVTADTKLAVPVLVGDDFEDQTEVIKKLVGCCCGCDDEDK